MSALLDSLLICLLGVGNGFFTCKENFLQNGKILDEILVWVCLELDDLWIK